MKISDIKASDRVEKLREQTFSYPMMAELPSNTFGPRMQLLLAEGWIASVGQATTLLRRSASQVHRMDNTKPVINDSELIVGCPDYSKLSEDEQKRLDAIGDTVSRCIPPRRGQYDHMAMDYEKLLKVGVNGLISEINQHREALDFQMPESIAKDEFYQACLMELEGLLRFIKKYVEHARKLAKSATTEQARELRGIADILEKVPAGPAKTFREALQSIHFYTFMLVGDYQMGRPDQTLIDFYRADIAKGELSPESAQELIDCFCLLYSAHHPKGSAVGFMLGGRDSSGNAVNNELTYLFLRSISHTRMAYPSIGLCVHGDTDEELLDMAVDALSKGYSHPAIFSDNAITRGLLDLGVPEADARNYIHSSCVEITICGRSGCWVISPYINMLTLLLELMSENSECETIEDFTKLYERKLRQKVVSSIRTQNLWQLERSRNGSLSILSSCLVNDCLKRGKSVDEGGADYNFIMPSFLGMANLVDSMLAIKTLVYEEKELGMAEFHQILMDDFKNHETLRIRILNNLPHFGNNDPNVDSLMCDFSEMVTRCCEGLVTYHNSKVVPGTFSYKRHLTEGEKTPATPDARLAGEPFAAASSPAHGRDTSGPTSSMLSSTCWDQKPFMGGVAVNFKIPPGSDSIHDNMKAIIKTFVAREGLQLQISCASKEDLLDAQKHPEKHRDLLVRIGGYSDYFTLLSPEMQNEVINRTEHNL